MTTLEILKAARARIADPKCWTQGALSRIGGVGGRPWVDVMTADCWCAQGALSYVCGGFHQPGRAAAVEALVGTEASLALFNDSHGHAEVLDLFDRTIARLSLP